MYDPDLSDGADASALDVRELAREVSSLRAELERLRAVVDTGGQTGQTTRSAPTEAFEATASRRGLIKLAGAAAAGAVAASLLPAEQAAALDGDPIRIADTTAVTSGVPFVQTVVDYSSATAGLASSANYFLVTDGATVSGYPSAVAGYGTNLAMNGVFGYTEIGARFGVVGVAGGSSGPNAAGVHGLSTDGGYGVLAASSDGVDLRAGGSGRVQLATHVFSGFASYSTGEIVRDASDDLWYCIQGGNPGTWRKLSGPATSGQLHLLPAPVRVIDTRPGQQPLNNNLPKGKLTPDAARAVALTQGTTGATPASAVPAGATGALINFVVTENDAAGFAAVWTNGTAWPGHSNINTFGPNQTLAATTVSAIDSSAVCQVRSSRPCHMIIDVIGYYR